MKENYYLVYSDNTPNCPGVILDSDENEDEFNMITEPIEVDVVKMLFMELFPKKPEMVDFHDDGTISAFSKKIYDVPR